jgi:uncharacterized membrane protein YjfL (UPF0719 family)
MSDWLAQHARPVTDSIIYAALGVLVLIASFWLIEKVLPFSLRKEVADDQNTALGIILGAFILGISMIISAAIQG